VVDLQLTGELSQSLGDKAAMTEVEVFLETQQTAALNTRQLSQCL
jgi:hypothetical protein